MNDDYDITLKILESAIKILDGTNLIREIYHGEKTLQNFYKIWIFK